MIRSALGIGDRINFEIREEVEVSVNCSTNPDFGDSHLRQLHQGDIGKYAGLWVAHSSPLLMSVTSDRQP
jgi:hypothetical protein